MTDDLKLEALRAAFIAADEAAPAVAAADLDAIQRALDGELGAQERSKLIERLSAEPGLAAAWRLALELRNGLESAPANFTRRTWIARNRTLLAAAAVVVATVAGLWLRAPSPPVERAPSLPAIVSRLAEGATLPRERFELTWQSPFDAASFDVDVLDADLRVLFRARGLTAARATVPATALAGLSAGSDVLWRVEARSPGGEVSASRTFVQRLE